MGHKLGAIPLFWRALDEIGNGDIVQEVYDVCFRLVDEGPALPGAEPTRFPLPPVVLDGWFLDLPSGAGFVGYGQWSEDRILLISLTLYDWNE